MWAWGYSGESRASLEGHPGHCALTGLSQSRSLASCHSDGPRAGLVLECKWLWLGASPLAEGEKLLTNPPGTAEFFHMERRNVRTTGLIISLAE